MAIATGLITSLFNVALSGDMPFCQPQQLQCFYHGFTFVLFLLHSFLPYRVVNDLWYVRYGFGARLEQVQSKQGRFLHYSLLELLAKHLKIWNQNKA